MPGLREIAEADLATILEDDVGGFAWPITVTNPAGVLANLKGFSADISQVIDPDTGQAVSGRIAWVTLRISSLTAAGFTLPEGVADPKDKPWLIQFDDVNGNSYTFKVGSTNPDRTLGIVRCLLESYKP